jgi:hypothetical protein
LRPSREGLHAQRQKSVHPAIAGVLDPMFEQFITTALDCRVKLILYPLQLRDARPFHDSLVTLLDGATKPLTIADH